MWVSAALVWMPRTSTRKRLPAASEPRLALATATAWTRATPEVEGIVTVVTTSVPMPSVPRSLVPETIRLTEIPRRDCA